MKKKLLIGTILPALAAAAVIGSGFALWVFDGEVKAQSMVQDDITKDITQLVKVGTIETASAFKIVFDQTDATRPNGFKNSNGIAATGITFVFGNGANVKKYAEYVAPKGTLGTTHNDGSTENHFSSDTVDGVIGYEFSFELSLPSTLASYVDFSFGGTKITPIPQSDRAIYKAKTSDSRKIYWGLNNEDAAHSITASYAKDKEPTNSEKYKELHDIIVNSAAISVKYEAQLVSLVK